MYKLVIKSNDLYYYIGYNKFEVTADPKILYKFYTHLKIADGQELEDGVYFVYSNFFRKTKLLNSFSEHQLDPVCKKETDIQILEPIDNDSQLERLKLIKSVLADNDTRMMRD